MTLRQKRVECNVCGWQGRAFYPNTGPGYDERRTLCPACRCLDRHRALAAVLLRGTDLLAAGRRVIECAPMRAMQELYRSIPGLDYVSFDLERFAMEQGDITAMRYADASADAFVAYHVLEHIPDERAAMTEIRRVLKPGGTLVCQVPLDPTVERSYEYPRPDPRETMHVRRYGRDFGERIGGYGFEVTTKSASDVCDPAETARLGLSPNPVYLARKP